VIFFLAVSFGSIALLVFSDASLSAVLVNLGLMANDPTAPTDPVGSLVGRVVLYSELLICPAIWVWGMLSDRIGRRCIFATGTALIAAAFIAMPFATTYLQVIGIRLVFAPGAAAVSAMLMALVCDYPRDDTHSKSRGKASAIMGILAGLGAIFALFGLMAIPSLFPADDKSSFMWMFFTAAGVAMVCGVVSFFGLAKTMPVKHYEHPGVGEMLSSGFKAMRDPYIVLAYLGSFSARGDSSVVTLFLFAWITSVGFAQGVSLSDAQKQAGIVTGVLQVMALVSAPAIGVLADRCSRAAMTLAVSVIGLAGYLLLGLLSDPFAWSWQLVAAVLCLGTGEMGMLIMSQSILGLHSPPATRGSISGFWSLCGSLGIMFGSGVGGLLYPLLPGAPFLIFAVFNAIVAAFATILYVREKVRGAPATPPGVVIVSPVGAEQNEEKEHLIIQSPA
jgi:MFS family permease